MDSELSEAACRDHDPEHFDHNRFPQARYGLAICAGCAVHLLCIATVRPQKSGFDGVAGNAVWRNGYRVRHDNSTREDRFILMRQQQEQTA